MTVTPATSWGEPGQERGHARDVAVVLAGLIGGAEVDVLDLPERYSGAIDRGGDRLGRQIVRPHARKSAAEAPDRGPDRRENDRSATTQV